MERHPIALKRVVYRIDGMESVPVRRDVEYASAGGGPLTFDVYLPPASGRPSPVAVLVTGYRDAGVATPFGCPFKEIGMWVSLAQLLAVSGIAAVGYTAGHPAADVHRLFDYLSAHEQSLGVDATRVGLWAVSGHVPTALAALARDGGARIKAAVLSTGFTLDLDGSTTVADAARTWRFANPSAGLSVRDLPPGVPLFVARAGRDQNAGLNSAIDRFVAAALALNLPVTIVNYAVGRHGFEIDDASAESVRIIRAMLTFLREQLTSLL